MVRRYGKLGWGVSEDTQLRCARVGEGWGCVPRSYEYRYPTHCGMWWDGMGYVSCIFTYYVLSGGN